MHVQEAYDQCKQIIEHHSKTFAKAFQHLPKNKRQAVWAVYAFCRTADDIVDEGNNSQKRLAQFKRELDVFFQGELPSRTPLWIALQDTFSQFDFDEDPFYDMIKGQEMDLVKMSYETIEDVINYSYHVASTVGLMLLPILAPDNKERLRQSAMELGYAMQITNILRDVGEDLDRGRKYLPTSLMLKHGYTNAMLEDRVINSSFQAVWEEMARLAEHYYEAGLRDMHLYPIHSRLPVQAAAHLYRHILTKVRHNHYDAFNKRAIVSSEQKTVILSGIAEIN
ncbi:phytoene/squalene synthase family protein [Paenalkalicoccus suaedae]|uniref:Phytoene/squalene synthase family protein n=1 Tax=Paenalkalicoccus suaedae TaxID=2592382 RepID=A0A859FDU2_9BACI|nr:phytoene/squalene synthase family protein [Paenalkalicoccus suaedae]QKS71008.1 phytoene/squalene synthase family protein [Paenalkalicoccus suaedae]